VRWAAPLQPMAPVFRGQLALSGQRGLALGPRPDVRCWMKQALSLKTSNAAATPAPLPGIPNRQMREYASIHWKPIRIPSVQASGFKARNVAATQATAVPGRCDNLPGIHAAQRRGP